MLWWWWVRVTTRRVRGWRRGGRGSAPFFAHRFRSRRALAETESLSAIINRDLARFILPHLHPATAGRPVSAWPLQLQQAVVIAHHPVLAHHPVFLQPEDLIQLPRRWSPPMIIGWFGGWTSKAAVMFGEVVFFQKAIGFFVTGDSTQPQLLDQPVLMRAVHALDSPFGLRRTGGDDLNP